MSGRGGKRLRGEGSSSQRQEERLDYERDFEGEEDLEVEGDFDSEDPMPRDINFIPDKVVFAYLDRDMPTLPAPKDRSKRTTPINNAQQVDGQSFCSFRFLDYRAHKTFLTDHKLNRKGTPEKRFPMSDRMPNQLINIFEREGLDNWFKLVNGKSSTTLVREILANIRFWRGKESRDPRHIFCRGRFFTLTPDTIRLALGFPPLVQPCAYQNELERVNSDSDLNVFCFGWNGTAQWEKRHCKPTWKVHKNAIKPEARWICELLENWVLGITAQPTYTYKLCTMAYCLYQGLRIDIPWFIYESLMERKHSECEKGPGHGYLLLALVRKFGISLPSSLLDVDPLPDRKYEKIMGVVAVKSAKAKAKRANERERQPEVGSSSGTPTDMAAILAYMQEMRMEEREERHRDRTERNRQFEHTRANHRKLGEIMETMGQHLVTNPGVPFPAPLNISPWYDSEGYVYPNYDQAEEAADDDE